MARARRAELQWRAERPDLDGLPMALLGRLAEAQQLISTQHLHPLFAEHGLRYGDFDVLATLRRAGAPYALTPTELYAVTMVTSGAMTGRIDSLEKKGLVERQPHPEDRRGSMVALTEAGFQLIDSIIGLHVANEQVVLAALSRDEQETLSELLRKLLAGLPPPYKERATDP